MPEGNQNHESFTGASQGSETASETQEQFSERYRQAQSYIKQIKKEESKKKKNDDSLAKIIVQFLGKEDKTAYFLLISRLVAHNIPSDFILSIIALIFKPAGDAIETRVDSLGQIAQGDLGNTPALFLPEEKEKIDLWTKNIMKIALAEKERILTTVLSKNDIVSPELIRLFAMVLRDFLESLHHEDVRMENMKSFANAFFSTILSELRTSPEEHKHVLAKHE